MKKKIFLGLILGGIVSIFILAGCEYSKKIDIDDCIKVNFKGYSGTAIFEGKVDNDKLIQIPALQKLTDKMLKGEYKVTLKADEDHNLKNGDKVKLKLEYNKDLYQRDFGVELVLKNPEVEVKGLNKLITKESDLTQEEWTKLNNAVNKKVDELAKNCGFKDKKYLCKVISVDKDNKSNDGIDYWYKFKKINGEIVYIRAEFSNSDKDFDLQDNIYLGTLDKWNYNDIDKPFSDILKKCYKDSNYTIIK